MSVRGLAVAVLCVAPGGSPSVARAPSRPAVRYQVEGPAGAVRAITVGPVAGGRLVADGMVPGDAAARYERESLVGIAAARPGSCDYAAGVRPFTRLRRFGAGGALEWSWDLSADKLALTLLGGPAACLSPDGTRLLVSIYSTEQGTALSVPDRRVAQGAVAVGRRAHGFVRPAPRAGTEPFGNPRTTGVVGWQPGRPATLIYEVGARVG